MSDIVQTLRNFGKAYPEDQFRPLTPGEMRLDSAIVTRVSAAMGRHCAKFMGEAADEIDKLRADLDRERMRLAACGVVAMANTPESAKTARDMLPEYRSASCDDVARMVDKQMELRAAVTALAEVAQVERTHHATKLLDVRLYGWTNAALEVRIARLDAALKIAGEAMGNEERA